MAEYSGCQASSDPRVQITSRGDWRVARAQGRLCARVLRHWHDVTGGIRESGRRGEFQEQWEERGGRVEGGSFFSFGTGNEFGAWDLGHPPRRPPASQRDQQPTSSQCRAWLCKY